MDEKIAYSGNVGNQALPSDVEALGLEVAPQVNTGSLDIGSLRLSQDYAGMITTTSKTLGIEISRPNRLEFIRTHPTWEYQAAMLEIDFEHYVLHPALFPKYHREASPKVLVPSITRRGQVFLWPIRLPGLDGRLDRWNQTARNAAELARTQWIRLISNRQLGDYDVDIVEGLPEPTWPADITSLEQFLEIAFAGKVIDSENHPVLQRLAGKDV